MSLSDMNIEELELLSYTDITYMLLKEAKQSMNTAEIFKRVCELLEYSEDDFTNKIGDFYTSLTIDKRFLLLEDASWDLRENHSIEFAIDEDDLEDNEEVDEEELEDENIEDEEENIDEINEDDNIDVDDDISELSVVEDEEELEDQM